MTTPHPHLSFGCPSIPLTFHIPDAADRCYVWAFISQCGNDYFDLTLGINKDEPDLILRGLVEIEAFFKWLHLLPEDPQMNCRPGVQIQDTCPHLEGEYENAQHLQIPCLVAMVEGRKVYVLAGVLETPGEAAGYTHWPVELSRAFAETLAPLITTMSNGTLDLRPTANPLDEEEEEE